MLSDLFDKTNTTAVYVKENKTLMCLIHSEVLFAEKGIVYEGMQMSQLDSYTPGRILHIISNNKIGLITNPKDGIPHF
jgi:2-oxoglutarate dehydrogenase complex dehydrogenase (E1) component-like enzyme